MPNPFHETFSDRLEVRCQPWLSSAVSVGAQRKGSLPSEYIRQAVIFALRADGVPLALDMQYALVSDGALVQGRHGSVTTFHPVPDERGQWVIIENIDSEPFDLATHWRMAPLPLRVDGERVVREFPVVLKSMERA